MKNETKSVTPTGPNELNLEALGQEELQPVAGGNIFGDAWDGIKNGAEWVGNEVENHPVAAVALAVGAVTGVDAVAGAVAVAGSDAAAFAGVSGGDLAVGAAAKTAAGVFSGGAVGGMADMFKKVIDDA
ncbi:MAG: hypothetical protein CMH13_00285 [Martelella sp.]|uniref:hypothetical protein n=1 Tax=unclassified Martelella TaxID=2629616 RepID=UPI000C4342A1|nr:hypothetical protein [Martelella sp.]MAU18958.1 hypothetical protein [Martelella sp.]